MAGGPITALLVAGQRPGIDPLAQHFGMADKALVPVGGEPMLSRVARTLVDHPAIGRVLVLAQEPDRLVLQVPWMVRHPAIATLAGGNSVSGAVSGAIAGGCFPYLLTTADNVLLTHAMIDSFLAGAEGRDIAAALVERETLLTAYPQSRRTWLRFRGGAWSGANLFWLGSPMADRALALWRTIEQDRKKGRAVIGAFGLLLLLGAVFRILTIDQAIARAGRRLGLDAAIVPMPQPEACIDVDKPEDHALAERILAGETPYLPHNSALGARRHDD